MAGMPRTILDKPLGGLGANVVKFDLKTSSENRAKRDHRSLSNESQAGHLKVTVSVKKK